MWKKVYFSALERVVVMLTGMLSSVGESAERVNLVIKETSRGKIHPGIVAITLTISPDSKRFAYVARRGKKQFVVLDGEEGEEYDLIGKGSLVFSPDSKRFAYVAVRGGKQFVVLDGEEGKEYDGIGDLVFSPDSKRFAYGAKRGGKWFVVLDGEEGKEKEYDGFLRGSKLVFDSPRKLHALAVRGDEIFLVTVEIQ